MSPRSSPDRWLRRQIERKLVEEISEAQRHFEDAERRFSSMMASVPSGIPAPDSTLRIEQAGAEVRRTLAALTKARSRWHEFVLRGTIPEDLLPE